MDYLKNGFSDDNNFSKVQKALYPKVVKAYFNNSVILHAV